MPKYEVELWGRFSFSAEVEAEDRDTAWEAAYDRFKVADYNEIDFDVDDNHITEY